MGKYIAVYINSSLFLYLTRDYGARVETSGTKFIDRLGGWRYSANLRDDFWLTLRGDEGEQFGMRLSFSEVRAPSVAPPFTEEYTYFQHVRQTRTQTNTSRPHVNKHYLPLHLSSFVLFPFIW